jgi:uncharacterized protein
MTRALRVAIAALLLLAAGLAFALPATALEVPYLSGRVVDEASLLTPEQAAALEEELRLLEEETGAQVVVLTVPSLEGEVLESYSLKVAETWGIGRERQDDGVVFLISRDDRKLRIEVGYGLEGVLPDLATSRIIRNLVVPEFKAGDYPGGIEAGVGAIAGAIREEPGAVPDDPQGVISAPDLLGRGFAGLLFLAVMVPFSLAALGGQGCQGWFMYVFLLPFYTIFPLAFLGMPVGLVPGALWLVGYPILRLLFGKTDFMRNLAKTTMSSGSSRGGGFRGGGFSGGGFSSGGGGGFSGGGGSFGGGGASGSW